MLGVSEKDEGNDDRRRLSLHPTLRGGELLHWHRTRRSRVTSSPAQRRYVRRLYGATPSSNSAVFTMVRSHYRRDRSGAAGERLVARQEGSVDSRRVRTASRALEAAPAT